MSADWKELKWPPRKEDLERLYVQERLSAAKIAKVYGLKYVDLDVTFEFLLNPVIEAFEEYRKSPSLFLSFLAGFTDAEGSIYFHSKGSGGDFEIVISNTDTVLLGAIRDTILSVGHHAAIQTVRQKPSRLGSENPGEISRLFIWRHKDVVGLLKLLPLGHGEKVLKVELALTFMETTDKKIKKSVLERWEALISRIHRDRDAFVMESELLYLAKHIPIDEWK